MNQAKECVRLVFRFIEQIMLYRPIDSKMYIEVAMDLVDSSRAEIILPLTW